MVIEIRNFDYKNIFKDLNIKIKKGDFITILGKSGSGESTLYNMMIGKIKDENIIINDKLKIGYVQNLNFKYNTVIDNLNKNENFKKIINYFKISKILDCNVNLLSYGEKNLIALIKVILEEPDVIIIDNVLSSLDELQKEKMLKLLKKINDNQTTIVNITKDSEESLYGKQLALISDKKIILNDTIKNAFKDEKVFKTSKIELPFMVDLSNKLKFYNLTKTITFDMKQMVNKLWK